MRLRNRFKNRFISHQSSIEYFTANNFRQNIKTMAKTLYIVSRDNILLEREIVSEDEFSITVKSKFYNDVEVTYSKKESVFRTKLKALSFMCNNKFEFYHG